MEKAERMDLGREGEMMGRKKKKDIGIFKKWRSNATKKVKRNRNVEELCGTDHKMLTV